MMAAHLSRQHRPSKTFPRFSLISVDSASEEAQDDDGDDDGGGCSDSSAQSMASISPIAKLKQWKQAANVPPPPPPPSASADATDKVESSLTADFHEDQNRYRPQHKLGDPEGLRRLDSFPIGIQILTAFFVCFVVFKCRLSGQQREHRVLHGSLSFEGVEIFALNAQQENASGRQLSVAGSVLLAGYRQLLRSHLLDELFFQKSHQQSPRATEETAAADCSRCCCCGRGGSGCGC